MDLLSVGLLIFFARIADVVFGTLKTIAVVKGWHYRASLFGFGEVVVWLLASAAVLTNISTIPLLGVPYCLGYVSGIWVGIRIEQYIASGDSVIRVLTVKGDQVTQAMRTEGCLVSCFEGKNRKGSISLLYIDTKRKDSDSIIQEVENIDGNAFCTVDDVRLAKQCQKT